MSFSSLDDNTDHNMHGLTAQPASIGVPAFLAKLWRLVEDEKTDELIFWDSSGTSFHVLDQGQFAKEVLPLYFKHNNIASFVRQLNMYGFRKVAHLEEGIKTEKDDMEFAHQYFVRGQPMLLEHIKRKPTSSATGLTKEEVKIKPDDVNRVLTEVNSMKSKQDGLNGKIDNLKRENEALWREIINLRQKHQKQQQIVAKLIQFLVSMVGNQGMGVKRPAPLMLQSGPSPSKRAKINELSGKINKEKRTSTATSGTSLLSTSDLASSSGSSTSNLSMSNASTIPATSDHTTCTIKDVTDIDPNSMFDTKVVDITESTPHVQEPLSVPSIDIKDVLEEVGIEDGTMATIPTSQLPVGTALPDSPILSQQPSVTKSSLAVSKAPPSYTRQMSVSKCEMKDHVESMQTDLDVLKDMLSGGNYTVDPSLLVDPSVLSLLFAPEAPLTDIGFDDPIETIQIPMDISQTERSTAQIQVPMSSASSTKQYGQVSSSDIINGNELIQYQPEEPNELTSLFDFGDLSSSSTAIPNLLEVSNPDLNTPVVTPAMSTITDNPLEKAFQSRK